MQNTDIRRNIEHLRQALADIGYSKGRILQFNSTTNQLLKFMAQHEINKYSLDVGMRFIGEKYGFRANGTLSHINQGRLQDLTMLSELQVHGTYMMRHWNRNYCIPAAYQKATNEFLAYRRFCGIIEKNMGTIGLYLERFFHYLTSQKINRIECITGKHIHGFLRYISAYSNQSKSHMMRTVRQFLEFCWKNGYHPENLTSFAPNVHYDKRAHIPSAYSYEDVIKILGTVDRSNPVGKRNYATMLLFARLGLRTGDVCGLRFGNLDWEYNRLTLIQHKTGRPLVLPLLEDVGLGIIDYLKFGRPNSNSDAVFLCHRPPHKDFSSSSLYGIVSEHIRKVGLTVQGKKRGPHSLRHPNVKSKTKIFYPLFLNNHSKIRAHRRVPSPRYSLLQKFFDKSDLSVCCLRIIAHTNGRFKLWALTYASNERRYPFRISPLACWGSPKPRTGRSASSRTRLTARLHASHDQQGENDVTASGGIAAKRRKGRAPWTEWSDVSCLGR